MSPVYDRTGSESFAQTPARPFHAGSNSEVMVKTVGSASVGAVVDLTANTRPAERLFSRFGTYVLPLAIAAAFAAPTPVGEIRRRTFSGANRTHLGIGDFLWAADGWTYTSEPVDYEHVMLLRDLLSLSTAEGLVLELPE
jgi:hypothetical protein